MVELGQISPEGQEANRNIAKQFRTSRIVRTALLGGALFAGVLSANESSVNVEADGNQTVLAESGEFAEFGVPLALVLVSAAAIERRNSIKKSAKYFQGYLESQGIDDVYGYKNEKSGLINVVLSVDPDTSELSEEAVVDEKLAKQFFGMDTWDPWQVGNSAVVVGISYCTSMLTAREFIFHKNAEGATPVVALFTLAFVTGAIAIGMQERESLNSRQQNYQQFINNVEGGISFSE